LPPERVPGVLRQDSAAGRTSTRTRATAGGMASITARRWRKSARTA